MSALPSKYNFFIKISKLSVINVSFLKTIKKHVANHFFAPIYPNKLTCLINICCIETNSGLYEQNNKLKAEISYLKSDLSRKQVEIDELIAKIKLMGEADKMLQDFKK